jgi:hypothetical protein
MKIVKRSIFSNPIGSMTIWLIPTMSYFFGKVGGIEYNREWIWWVGIPTLILGWLVLNFKIKKI